MAATSQSSAIVESAGDIAEFSDYFGERCLIAFPIRATDGSGFSTAASC
jgi:hypothetical protein